MTKTKILTELGGHLKLLTKVTVYCTALCTLPLVILLSSIDLTDSNIQLLDLQNAATGYVKAFLPTIVVLVYAICIMFGYPRKLIMDHVGDAFYPFLSNTVNLSEHKITVGKTRDGMSIK